MEPREELKSTIDLLIGIVSERLADLRVMQDAAPDAAETPEYYKVRLGLAFLLGMRDRA